MDTCILNDMLAHYDLHNYRVMPDNFCLIRASNPLQWVQFVCALVQKIYQSN